MQVIKRQNHQIKNNKIKLGHTLYALSLKGSHSGYLIRIKAVSYRRRHQGNNRWDLFHFCVPDGMHEVELSTSYAGGDPVARYEGIEYYINFTEGVPTPFGEEEKPVGASLRPVPFEEWSEGEAKAVAIAAADAVAGGFGPHGEIENAEEISAWVKEVLG